jgi:hypothetical protein
MQDDKISIWMDRLVLEVNHTGDIFEVGALREVYTPIMLKPYGGVSISIDANGTQYNVKSGFNLFVVVNGSAKVLVTEFVPPSHGGYGIETRIGYPLLGSGV